ncbi:hypothetical protein [Fundidesulfovibrio soli]|uniref:hypothetical protein n=1 Tax=Fundidesulfovibrio soli TaxID=2922716 RepID=UPI001FB00907|nr:hypothetical protein [Fundidesulfovibrio soli]
MQNVEILLSQLVAAQMATARYTALTFWVAAKGSRETCNDLANIIQGVEDEISSAAKRIAHSLSEGD